MSDYDDISIQLTALADGELPPDEADALRRQIDADPALAEEFRQIQSVCSLLGQLPRQTLSPNFAAGVTARLHRKRFVGRFTRIAAAAVVALTTTLIVLHSNDTESDDTLASKTKSSEVRPAPARDELDLSSDKKLGTDRSALDAREEVVAKDTAVPSPEGHVHSPTTKSAEKVIASLESETVRRRAGKPGHLSRVTGGAMNKTNSTPSISEIDTATVETTLPGANWDAPGASPNAKRATIPPLAAPTEPDEIAIAPDITSNEGLLDVHSPREPEAIIASKGESRITFSIGDEPRRSMKKTATPEPPPVATAETVNLYTDNLPREQKALETFFASNRIAFTNVNAPSQTGSKEIIKKIGENQELQYTKVAEADSDDAYETVEYVLTVDDSQLAALNTKLMPARQNFNINVSQMSDTLHRGLQTQADLEERGRVIAMVEKEIATTQRAKLSRPAAKAKTPAKADGWAMSPVADPTTPSAPKIEPKAPVDALNKLREPSAEAKTLEDQLASAGPAERDTDDGDNRLKKADIGKGSAAKAKQGTRPKTPILAAEVKPAPKPAAPVVKTKGQVKWMEEENGKLAKAEAEQINGTMTKIVAKAEPTPAPAVKESGKVQRNAEFGMDDQYEQGAQRQQALRRQQIRLVVRYRKPFNTLPMHQQAFFNAQNVSPSQMRALQQQTPRANQSIPNTADAVLEQKAKE